MRTYLSFLLACVLFITFGGLASAEKRIALVIGNSAYKSSPLRNPKNDAELMASTLKGTGFDVTLLTDVTHHDMKLAMIRFGRKLRSTDTVGLFYYAGHGVQVRGNNYLIPVDAEIQDESEVDVFAIDVNDYLRTMERSSSRINIVVLDACRNNPFASSFRSQSRGLARVDAPKGTYIAYATAPGRVAQDGTKGNSPYTQALANAIRTAGLTLEETFKQARRDVLAATGERQIPWETSSITGRFYFKPGAYQPRDNVEDGTWNLVKNSTYPEVIKTYLRAYPNGKYATQAKALVAELLGSKKLKTASLQSPAADTIETTETDTLSEDEKRALAFSIQKQLQRLGCGPGRPDGSWGRRSRAALERFARYGRVKLAGLSPSQVILDTLQNQSERVCPPICGRREVLKGNQCVTKTCRSGQRLNRSGQCVERKKESVKKKQKPKAKKAPATKTSTKSASTRKASKPARRGKTRGRKCSLIEQHADNCRHKLAN